MAIRGRAIEGTCANCGTNFQYSRIERKNRRYCSRACYHETVTADRIRGLTTRVAISRREKRDGAIQGSGGTWFYVDPEDQSYLERFAWTENRGYAKRWIAGTGKSLLMSREVLERKLGRMLQSDEIAEHRDTNPRNNRRANLRVADGHQNHHNRSPNKNQVSRYKGVTYTEGRRKPWKTQIGAYGLTYYIGTFESEADAAYMHDCYAIAIHGDYAYLNFEYV